MILPVHWPCFGLVGGWVVFGLSSGLREGISPGAVLLHTAVPGLVFLASVAVAWRWPRAGGNLLVAEGLAALLFYPAIALGQIATTGVVLVVVTMALPPLVAGLLLRDSARQPRVS